MYNKVKNSRNIPQASADKYYGNSALNQLTAFENKNKNSDLKNSYTLLSEKLFLINSAIEEAKSHKNEAVQKDLENKKISVIKQLESIGYKVTTTDDGKTLIEKAQIAPQSTGYNYVSFSGLKKHKKEEPEIEENKVPLRDVSEYFDDIKDEREYYGDEVWEEAKTSVATLPEENFERFKTLFEKYKNYSSLIFIQRLVYASMMDEEKYADFLYLMNFYDCKAPDDVRENICYALDLVENRKNDNAHDVFENIKKINNLYEEKGIDFQIGENFLTYYAQFDRFTNRYIDIISRYKDVDKLNTSLSIIGGQISLSESKYKLFEKYLELFGEVNDENLIAAGKIASFDDKKLSKKCYKRYEEYKEKYGAECINYVAYITENKWNDKQIAESDALIDKIGIKNWQAAVKFNQIKDISSGIEKSEENLEYQKQKMLEHPELYINGDFNNDKEKMCEQIEEFIKRMYDKMLIFSYIFDKETFNTFMRMRFDDVLEYSFKLNHINPKGIKLISDLCNSHTTEGKAFTPTEKIQFINIVSIYEDNNLSTDKIDKMVAEDKVDVLELQNDLFGSLLKNLNFNKLDMLKVSSSKLNEWDINYIHLLLNQVKESGDKALEDLFKAYNLDNFNEYIQNKANKYGVANAKTKSMYENHGMNYEEWLKPSEEDYIQYKTTDKNGDQLLQNAEQIRLNIEALRNSPAKAMVDKILSNYIKDDKFIIPEDIVKSKAQLLKLNENLLKQLTPIFNRAEGNKDNPQKAVTANNTLTVREHLNQCLKNIDKITGSKRIKKLDLTIKMWDRNPSKDLFQGNYSTCCIGMGECNGWAMPHYIMNTAFNMIELVDNNTGKTIGNALCYFAENEEGKPVFVIDNIEIGNSKIPSQGASLELRNQIAKYAQNVAKKVTGEENPEIYLGTNYNDVPCDGIKSSKYKFKPIGAFDRKYIYMDSYNLSGRTNQDVNLYKLY